MKGINQIATIENLFNAHPNKAKKIAKSQPKLELAFCNKTSILIKGTGTTTKNL
jgi:hypothetical protein